ncbi:ricin-type beta-trefoil lectin domain protein [Micromonospora sp. NBC_01813]|uniref:ricin-type beta-trefoil lectin domain protein n=1 Tax=Micromonospora sp. NBC_01813 TaxID=2975988 RepID=UPI002DD90688|nr:ricin-type beta-trefoil lectin domain protein [Micromonospora sp. NBC_01813]WSA10339.1 ricin-type beta-trefoil lectin domain protein [Micromonospora sp. NBC_01813]
MRLTTSARRVIAGVALSAAALCTMAASAQFTAAAAAGMLQGADIPASDQQVIVAAARSCPTLTSARLAGQLMTASQFKSEPVQAISGAGGKGVAGLTDPVWRRWAPWPQARLTDRSASIHALARHMCQLVGQLRIAQVPGDPWRLALAAHQLGVPAVQAAAGVPVAADDYVATVERYAQWYALYPAFGGTGPTAQTPDQVAATPAPVERDKAIAVPDVYLEAVRGAGDICPTITATRVAAQIMAQSGFDPNLLGPAGGQGIAQFLPQVWVQYVQAAGSATPWDAQVAIPALGRTMCRLVEELTPVSDDPYPLALAAFHWGAGTIQTAGDLDDSASLAAFTQLVRDHETFYADDQRLMTVGSPSPSPSATPAGTPPPLAAPSPTTPPAPTKTPAAVPGPTSTTAAAKPSTPAPKTSWLIVNHKSNKCLTQHARPDAIGNIALTIATCTGAANQLWEFKSDKTLRAQGMCMDLENGRTDQGIRIGTAKCNGSTAQHFYLNGADDLTSLKASDRHGKLMCVDVYDGQTADGSRLLLWPCMGQPNQSWSRR